MVWRGGWRGGTWNCSPPRSLHPIPQGSIPSLRLLPGQAEELGWEGGEISWKLLDFLSKQEGSELK